MRGRHASAVLIRSAIGKRSGCACITERDNHRRAVLTGYASAAEGTAATPRCAQGGTGADVGVISIVAADGVGRYRHDATAVCGLIGAIAAAITVGDNDDGTSGIDVVNGALERRRTAPRAAKTEVENTRRVTVTRHTRLVNARGPAHRVDDIGGVTAALSQYQHGQQFYIGRDTSTE